MPAAGVLAPRMSNSTMEGPGDKCIRRNIRAPSSRGAAAARAETSVEVLDPHHRHVDAQVRQGAGRLPAVADMPESVAEGRNGAIIEPRTPKGFRDALPPRALAVEQYIGEAVEVMHRHGFTPIRTPALEFEEVLTGKGGTESDRQMYRFATPSGRRVGLRFDLTVPLARFVSQHRATLSLPASLYQWGTVWRGENTQRGRSREFLQFDFDTLGGDSAVADAGIVIVVHEILRRLKAPPFTIRLNNRKLLTNVVRHACIPESAVGPVLRVVDKLAKLGHAVVETELAELGATPDQIRVLLDVVEMKGPAGEVVQRLEASDMGAALDAGAERLVDVSSLVQAAGIPPEACIVDLSIARGLDYYTGIVFETTLDDLPAIGSVCSGGRYDQLTTMFSRGEPVAGVGGSIGMDRLLDATDALGLSAPRRTAAFVLFAVFDEVPLECYLALASRVRSASVSAQVFPAVERLQKQMRFADRSGFGVVVLVGPDELASGIAQVRRLADGSTTQAPFASLPTILRAMSDDEPQPVSIPGQETSTARRSRDRDDP